MAILLDDLLCEISNAVCNANRIMETTAWNQYMEGGYKKLGETEQMYAPIMFNLSLKDHKEVRKIPISGLMHNTTMRLEQVDMKIKFKMFEQDNHIMVECMSNNEEDERLNEMTLQFKNSVSAEGISKITDAHMKNI